MVLFCEQHDVIQCNYIYVKILKILIHQKMIRIEGIRNENVNGIARKHDRIRPEEDEAFLPGELSLVLLEDKGSSQEQAKIDRDVDELEASGHLDLLRSADVDRDTRKHR